MVNNKSVLDKFDLSSVNAIFTGAAPLGAETAQDLQKQYPTWQVRQGYGETFQELWAIITTANKLSRVDRDQHCSVLHRCP